MNESADAPDPRAASSLEQRLSQVEFALSEIAAVQLGFRHEVRERWREEDAILRRIDLWSQVQIEATRRERDGIAGLKAQLEKYRHSDDYARSWDDTEPLVSVRIASYQKTEELVDVALESVLRQSYDRLEVIVVNDGPNPRTRDALAKLGDPRVQYFELPERGSYPSHPHLRWMVAGAPPMNEAARRASGRWIAPLDDDDEFADDHIERILSLALEKRAELAYGALIQRDRSEGVDRLVFSDPPRAGAFSFQSTIYLAGLRFFEYDEESWRVDEPGDWNLARRMVAAGVRMQSTDEIHAFMNMVRFDQRGDV